MTFGAAADHEIAEILFAVESHFRAQRELALRRLDASGRQLHVLATQRILDIRDRELTRGQRLAIDPDAHRGTAGT